MWSGIVLTMPPVHVSCLRSDVDVSSHTTPAGDAAPATTQVGPPSVKWRTAVAGSTTCSSCGDAEKGPPPCVHAGTLATTRLSVPCQPIGQRLNAFACE